MLANDYANICLDDDFKKYKNQKISKEETRDKSYHIRLKIPDDVYIELSLK